MRNRTELMQELVASLTFYAKEDGNNPTAIENFFIYKHSATYTHVPEVYSPGIVICAQGNKRIFINGYSFELKAGTVAGMFVPMPVGCELVEADVDSPFLSTGFFLDRKRLSEILIKLDRVDYHPPKRKDDGDVSAIFFADLQDNLLDAIVRLLKTLENPGEAAIIGEAILDEIYFRILSEEQGGALRHHLQQQGQIQQISRAVDYVHQNLDKTVSIHELAALVNMSSSGFHKKFKEVMHLSPLQYAKFIKLNKAQTYISEGVNVSEAGFLVGYNSPAQFSREYKRHFGISPSEGKGHLVGA